MLSYPQRSAMLIDRLIMKKAQDIKNMKQIALSDHISLMFITT